MRVFVKNINGESITCASTEDSVESVKEAILDIEGIPVEDQRLIFEGKEMEDGRSLSFYNVREDSTVHLLLRLPGGHSSSVCGTDRNLANYHVLAKKICRKCYGRLPQNAEKCRKKKCSRNSDIREKRKYGYDLIPKKFGNWNEYCPIRGTLVTFEFGSKQREIWDQSILRPHTVKPAEFPTQ